MDEQFSNAIEGARLCTEGEIFKFKLALSVETDQNNMARAERCLQTFEVMLKIIDLIEDGLKVHKNGKNEKELSDALCSTLYMGILGIIMVFNNNPHNCVGVCKMILQILDLTNSDITLQSMNAVNNKPC